MEGPAQAPEVEISVVISTYNRAGYLRDCLSSLANQVCDASYEVVVIDNGSIDDTPDVLRSWCALHPRFRTAREPVIGLSRGKNTGIRLARGRLLMFTDDDVIADPRWIDSYLSFFARRSADLVLAGGPCVPVPDDLGEWPGWFDEPSLSDLGMLHYSGERPLGMREYVWGGNMIVPRSTFDKFGFWDETVGRRGDEAGTYEDTEYQDRIRTAGGTVWFCPTALVQHREPRHDITPKRVSRTAFARGRNGFWIESLRSWSEVDAVPKRSLIIGVTVLAGNLVRWVFWTIAFRLISNKRIFERVRRAAWSSGWALDNLRAGRSSSRRYRLIGRMAIRVRRLVLRLTPDGSR